MRPVLFQLGPVAIQSYGTMLLLALILGYFIAVREARRRGISPESFTDFVIYAFLTGLVTARLLYVLLSLNEFLHHPISVLYIHQGGLSIHGGLAGGILAGIFFTRRRRIPFWRLADVCAPSLILGQAVGRVGCFLNGDSWGILTNLPWGVYTRYVSGLRHPVQLYEAVLNLLLFTFLWWFRPKARREGQVFFYYVAGYSSIRFGVEFVRDSAMLTPHLSVAQAASFVLAALALGANAWLARRRVKAA